MRRYGMVLAAGLVGLVLVSLADGQGQGPTRGGFQAPTQDPLSLLRDPKVKEELKLTDEQMAKVPAVVLKALGDVLSPEQFARLKQIELQQKGTQAFTDPTVQTALKFTDDQKERITIILDDAAKDMKQMREGLGKGGDFKEMFGKIAAARKETTEKVQSVLTADQKKQWTDMVGEELQLNRGGFGFGGGTPGGDNKKRFDFKKKTENN